MKYYLLKFGVCQLCESKIGLLFNPTAVDGLSLEVHTLQKYSEKMQLYSIILLSALLVDYFR